MKRSRLWVGVVTCFCIGAVVGSCSDSESPTAPKAEVAAVPDKAADVPNATDALELPPMLSSHLPPALNCMQDVTPFGLQCTANDVRVAETIVTDPMVIDCLEGEVFDLPLAARVVAGAKERYDIGLFVALDGGDALTGECARSWLFPPLNTTPTPTGTVRLPPYFNAEATEDPLDMCGDTEQGILNELDLGTIQVECRDDTGPDGVPDGKLDIGTCTSWDNAKSDEGNGGNKAACTNVDQTLPGTPSKCRCETVTVDIIVRKVAQLEVEKDLNPFDDPGLFSLQIDGVTDADATNIGDGGSTEIETVSAGTAQNPGDTHTVGEVVGSPNPGLQFYNSSISCVDRGEGTFNGGAPLTANGTGPLDVPVDPEDDIVCTITNDRIPVPTVSVSKDATPTFTRTWEWTLDKSADQTGEIIRNTGDPALPVNYTVAVNASDTDTDHQVSGTITIDVTDGSGLAFGPYSGVFTVTDDAAGTAATVDCDGDNVFTVTAAGQYQCSYTATTATGGTNTATVDVDWNTGVAEDEQQGTADYAFTTPTTETDEFADVTDTPFPEFAAAFGNPATVDANQDIPKTFTYTRDLLCDRDQGDNNNTAKLVTNDTGTELMDTWLLSLTCLQPPDACTLTQGYWKTHNSEGPVPMKKWNDAWDDVGGPNAPFFLSNQSYFVVMWTPPRGNAYYNLAHQWIAAELNEANGALITDPAIQAAFDAGEAVLSACTPDEIDALKGNKTEKCSVGDLGLTRNEIIALAGILGGFNELGGQNPQCTEEPNGVPG